MTHETAILAGGCFWGMEELFRQLPGVTDTDVGYTGGTSDQPVYTDVKTGTTGHAEAIKIVYDPSQTTFEAILRFFFQAHDPTTAGRQGNDIGTQYRSVIFYTNDQQKAVADALIAQIDASGRWPGKVVTELAPADTFYPAEDFHQDYLQKNPNGYTCHWIRTDWTLD